MGQFVVRKILGHTAVCPVLFIFFIYFFVFLLVFFLSFSLFFPCHCVDAVSAASRCDPYDLCAPRWFPGTALRTF